MNRLFKLLYVQILGLFDINKIKIARESGVKSNLEKRVIIVVIAGIFFGYLLYKLFTMYTVSNKLYILGIGFIFSSLLCFFMDLFLIEPVVFKNDENDIIFSLPLSRYQILFSKLFVVYLRNLVYVFIIMLSLLLAYMNYVKILSDEFIIMYIVSSLLIPLIPIVLATIISYINSYCRVKISNKVVFNGIRLIILILLLGLISIIFRNINTSSLSLFIETFIKKMNVIYPMGFLFYEMLLSENVLFFLLNIIIPIFVIYVYSLLISNNYLKLCSMLKGVKKKVNFVYKKQVNLHRVLGMVKKEVISLISNKVYLFNSFGTIFIATILLFILSRLVNLNSFNNIEYFDIYFCLYCPTILAMLVTLNSSAISAISLEKDNMQMLRTMPINMAKVLFSKWLTNVLIGSIFIICNAFIVFSKYNKISLLIFNMLLPLSALMFVSLTSILLDYRFINKGKTNDNAIIKQRLITIVPTFLSFVIGIGPLFLQPYSQYKLLLASYILLFFILMIIEVSYLLINNKKLLRGMFN